MYPKLLLYFIHRCLISIMASPKLILAGKQLINTHTLNQVRYASRKLNIYDMNFDRRVKIDYKESIKYLSSETFKLIYQDELIWKVHRRNHMGQYPSKNSRPSCINEEGLVITSYPCPICKDEYLVLHPENHLLLKQFISPYTGKVYTVKEHGLCQRQYRNLQIAVMQARDIGTITYDIPEEYLVLNK